MRLDRFVCCSDWEELFPESLLQSAAAGVSDHCLLTLGLQVQIPKKKRFHFESFWPKLPGSLEVVSQNWDAPVSTICSVECVFLKLQRLNKGLQGWSKRKVGNVILQLAMAKEILHHLGIARDFRGHYCKTAFSHLISSGRRCKYLFFPPTSSLLQKEKLHWKTSGWRSQPHGTRRQATGSSRFL